MVRHDFPNEKCHLKHFSLPIFRHLRHPHVYPAVLKVEQKSRDLTVTKIGEQKKTGHLMHRKRP